MSEIVCLGVQDRFYWDGLAVLRFYKAVCGIKKFSGNFNAVCGFLMLFCAVFTRTSVRFCGIGTPSYAPHVCLLVKMASKTVTRSIINAINSHIKCPERKFLFVSKINLLLT